MYFVFCLLCLFGLFTSIGYITYYISVTFESLPQALIQAVILLSSVSIFKDDEDVQNFVSQNEVLISAVIAVVNGSLQFARIYCEAKAVDEKFIQHALNCAISRVKWLPFERKLIALLRAGGNTDDANGSAGAGAGNKQAMYQLPKTLSYKISYDVPFFTWFLSKFGCMHALTCLFFVWRVVFLFQHEFYLVIGVFFVFIVSDRWYVFQTVSDLASEYFRVTFVLVFICALFCVLFYVWFQLSSTISWSNGL